jgi:hypothetical protein
MHALLLQVKTLHQDKQVTSIAMGPLLHLVFVHQLLLQLLQSVQAPCSDDELASCLCQAPRNGLAKAGAGTWRVAKTRLKSTSRSYRLDAAAVSSSSSRGYHQTLLRRSRMPLSEP